MPVLSPDEMSAKVEFLMQRVAELIQQVDALQPAVADDQQPNTVYAGPTGTRAGPPTFRALVAGDIPPPAPLPTIVQPKTAARPR